MKLIKSIFTSGAFWVLGVMPPFFIWCIVYFHDPVHRYVGTVIEVSSWDGSAKLKTKTETGKDTLLNVVPSKYENFEEGQVITVWTGGDLFDGIASTEPQH
jgi:hypothetical protein